MPQGGIEDGETPRVAALRELAEETSVTQNDVVIIGQTSDWLCYDLPADLVPKLWNGRYRGQKQMWYLMQFTGADSAINIQTDCPEFFKLAMDGGGGCIDAYRAVQTRGL